MINSGMTICSFYLKKRYSKGTNSICELNNNYECMQEDGTTIVYSDAFEMFKKFCEANFTNCKDENKLKTFSIDESSIERYEHHTYRAMAFTIVSGSYGIESDLTDSDTNEILFHRESNVADNKKFNVLIFLPKDAGETIITKGIFIFQSISTYGIKTLAVDKMKEFFGNIGLTINTRSVSVSEMVQNLIQNDNLYKITLIKNHISSNPVDNMLISTGREEQSFLKPRFQPQWLEKMLFLFDKKDTSGCYEIDGAQFEDIRIQFEMGGRIRTATLSTIDRFSMIVDFPEKIFNDGRYNRSELINHMIETANSYKEKMVFTVNSEVDNGN